MKNIDWKVGDIGYFFFTYLWQTTKATIVNIYDEYLEITDEFNNKHIVKKEEFFKTEKECELSL